MDGVKKTLYHFLLVSLCSFLNVLLVYVFELQGLGIYVVVFFVFIVVGLFSEPGVLGFIDAMAVIFVSSLTFKIFLGGMLHFFFLLPNPVVLILALAGVFVGWFLQSLLKFRPSRIV